MKELRIAHLSDLHLNGSLERRGKLLRGLAQALEKKADHLLLTGDLTSKGRESQFEELAACLMGWPSERVTIVPGNHDEGGAFDSAMLDGSLRRFARTSLIPVDLGAVRIVPIDTRYEKRAPIFKAVGNVGRAQLAGLAKEIFEIPRKPLLIAMHHGPQLHPLHVLDGLSDRAQVLRLMELRDDVHIACGHDHRVLDLGRIHVAASVAHHKDPLRMYTVADGKFQVGYKSEEMGYYMTLGSLRGLDGQGR